MSQPARYRKKDIALIRQWSGADQNPSGGVDPESLLPLSDSDFHVLLAVAVPPPPVQGQVIPLEQDANIRRLAPAIVRATLSRLIELGLLEETVEASTISSGERRHAATALGIAVLFAESGRRRRGKDSLSFGTAPDPTPPSPFRREPTKRPTGFTPVSSWRC